MEQGYHGGSKPTFTHAIEAVQRSADGPPLPSSHKETQPFLHAIQRSADGSSNSRETTQPFLLNHTTTSPLSHPARKSQHVRRVLPVAGLCRRGALLRRWESALFFKSSLFERSEFGLLENAFSRFPAA